MKLYIAISGSSEDEVLKALKAAVNNEAEFIGNNAFIIHSDGYQIDFSWSDEDGDAFLADLMTYEM